MATYVLAFGATLTSGRSCADVETTQETLSLRGSDHSPPPEKPLDAVTVNVYSTPVTVNGHMFARSTRTGSTSLSNAR